MKKFLIIDIVFVLILIGGIAVGYCLTKQIDTTGEIISLNKISNYSQCSNLSLDKTAICLRNYVNSFYNYTLLNQIDGHNIPDRIMTDIINNGGNCYDYSNLYVKMANDLGFNAKTISLPNINLRDGHMIAIIWNNDVSEYCIADQTYMHCEDVK